MTSTTKEIPWLVAAERVYGPLADAFGLRPLRDLSQTWSDLIAAQLDELSATAQVAGVMLTGAIDGAGRFARHADRLRSEGETVGSSTALLRAGLREFDSAMHVAMLSEAGLAATAATVRAASMRRTSWQKMSALVAESVGQPTRVDVDEAFREIQQLKREIRALKREPARAKGGRT
jgi:Poly(R)-hydroxyalkanoic acid synthase subunit (PHA_synth_III_E)